MQTPAATLGPTLFPADFNQDGLTDLAAVSASNGGESFVIYFSNGDGTFQSGPSGALSAGPSGYFPQTPIVVGDVNGDGQPDVIGISEQTTGSFDGAISTYLNQTGSFSSPITSSFTGVPGTTGFLPGYAAVGDFNNDGRADLAVEGTAVTGGGASADAPQIAILLGQSNGSFSEAHVYFADTRSQTVGLDEPLVVGHFNSDANLDIALDNSGNLDVLLGTGGGAFSVQTTPGSTVLGSVIAAGDFNGDHLDDLVTGGVGSDVSQIQVLTSNGNGTFSAKSAFETNRPVDGLVSGDFDQDGRLDAATGSGAYLGDGVGSFSVAVPAAVGTVNGFADNLIAPILIRGGGPGLVGIDANGINAVTSGTEGALQINTTLSLTPSSGTVAAGENLSLTAAVTPQIASSTIPGGTVTFLDGGVVIGSAALAADGTASFSTTTLANGPHSITADYSGDPNYFSSVAAAVIIQITPSVGGSLPPPPLLPIVAKTTVPASVIAGNALRSVALVDVNNATAAIQRGLVNINIYASSDQTLDGTDTKVLGAKRGVLLAPGKKRSFPLLVSSLPASMSSGFYYLIIQVIDTTGNSTIGEAANIVQVAARTVSLSEKIVKSSLAPAVIAGKPSGAATLMSVTNNGNVPSVGPVTVTVYASNTGALDDASTQLRHFTVRLVLLPKQTRLLGVQLGTFSSALNGDYQLITQVSDPLGQMSSVATDQTVNVGPPFVSLTANVDSITPDSLKSGTFTLVQLTLENNGNITSTGVLHLELGVSADGVTETESMARITAIVPLRAGAHLVLKLRVRVPNNLAGTYQSFISLQQGDQSVESIGNVSLSAG